MSNDIRIPHKGDIQHEVIEGAFRVLEDFEAVGDSTAALKATTLSEAEQHAFGRAALELRYGEQTGDRPTAPVTVEQLIEARRAEDTGGSLWSTFQRVQENVMRGGLPARSVQGRRMRTRPVGSIDRDVSLNRALWVLAEAMQQIKR